MGMEVHHQGAADSPQRQGEVLWEPMGVARVDHDVAGGDARLGHGDEHVGHLRHRVVVAGDDVHPSQHLGHWSAAAVGHHGPK
ncbi:MAG: hypothetical protein M0Z82_05835 [Actinomycetota bacterium]|nr:hypothetical protein [Actinomycetota bacterium]